MRDASGKFWILDFGLVKHLDLTSITPTGHGVGTLGYAPIEQMRLMKAPIDIRADLFAIGTILYESLCGFSPWRQGVQDMLIDADPQGSIATILGLAPERYFFDFVVGGLALEDCIVQPRENLHVLCSNRRTAQAETILAGMLAQEYVLDNLFSARDSQYGLVVVDVSSSITRIQTCAMVYTKNLLIPVAMDILSFQGAGASIETAKNLSQILQVDIRALAILPVMVHRRHHPHPDLRDGL